MARVSAGLNGQGEVERGIGEAGEAGENINVRRGNGMS